ncbi:MAG TPA: glycosyltransferase family 9 protein [Roseiflexaceae bacterium]|nr:glycosyltransferase family 9 protein [Roseiflexaceae bacterium]
MPSQRRSQCSILNFQFRRWIRLLLLYLLAILAHSLVRRRAGASATILYIKPDHLGDLLLATPVLAALRQRLPQVHVAALVGPWSRMVLQRNPDIDSLLTCPFPGFERRPADDGPRTNDQGPRLISVLSSLVLRLWSLSKPYLTLLRYALLLRASRYDLAIVGRDDHWWGAALALLAGIPVRVGHAVPECRPFLTTRLPWNPRDHVTTQGLALVEATVGHYPPSASGAAAGEGLGQKAWPARFDPAPEDSAWAQRWLGEHGLAGAPLVVLHPGTGGPAKLWFAERWAAVADGLQAAGAQLVLTGGPDEQALVAEVAAHMQSSALSLAGQTSLGQLAALLRRSALVLGVDSGPLHLAAAQGVPTLHLYGPGDAARFGPWGDPARHIVLREELWCSPCGEFAACPRGLARPECMELLSVARVTKRAREMLAGRPSAINSDA